jgi:hypothetical protein
MQLLLFYVHTISWKLNRYIRTKKIARLENLAFSLNGNHAYEKNCLIAKANGHSSKTKTKYYTFFWNFIFNFCATLNNLYLPCFVQLSMF